MNQWKEKLEIHIGPEVACARAAVFLDVSSDGDVRRRSEGPRLLHFLDLMMIEELHLVVVYHLALGVNDDFDSTGRLPSDLSLAVKSTSRGTNKTTHRARARFLAYMHHVGVLICI